MSTGRRSMCGVTKWKVWAMGLTFAVMVLFLSAGNPASAETILTYDDFSSGSIDLAKWAPNFTTSFLTVVTGSSVSVSQPYVLHGTGSGDSTFPRGALHTVNTFSGHFGAAVTFFNFSRSGTLPQATDPRSSSVTLVIGDFGTAGPPSHNYYIVSRTVRTDGTAIIGWRAFEPSGDTVVVGGVQQRGSVLYSETSGALELSYDPITHELELGYFSSTDPSAWDGGPGPTKIASFTDVYFSGDPRLGINYAPGNTGSSATVDVGGLYYADISDDAPVPAPAAILLFAPGLLGIAGVKRKLKKQR